MKTFYKFFLCLVFALLPFSNIAEANSVQAQVIEVINCYSLKVLTDGETKVVRLAEVICPHTHLNPLACENEAKHFLREITSGKSVKLLFWAIDSTGRSVCEVFLNDGTSLGGLMVSKGHLLQDQYYSESVRLRSLEKMAKKRMLGIWKHVDNYTSVAVAKSSFVKW
jgi:endonuclease YncB( thermonuclease family)